MDSAPYSELIRIDHDGPRPVRELAEDHLAEAEHIVREMFPEAVSVVVSNTEQSDNLDTLRITYILGRHGVLLYRTGERDPYVALIETHLADALARTINHSAPHPDSGALRRVTCPPSRYDHHHG